MARDRVQVASIRLSALRPLSRLWAGRREAEVALAGMPPRRIRTTISVAGRFPSLLIYLPVLLHCLHLAWRHRSFTLPSVANPNIECGGFRGESKMSYLEQIPPGLQQWVACSTRFATTRSQSRQQRLEAVLRTLDAAGLTFPLVAKPDIGSQGYGVRLVASLAELAEYLDRFPPGEAIILQRYVDWEGEAGVHYVRRPGDAVHRRTGYASGAG